MSLPKILVEKKGDNNARCCVKATHELTSPVSGLVIQSREESILPRALNRGTFSF